MQLGGSWVGENENEYEWESENRDGQERPRNFARSLTDGMRR